MVYVEVFGGGGSVLLNKERSVREVLNDRYLVAMNESGMLFYDGKTILTKQAGKCSTGYCSAPVVGSIRCGDPELEEELVEEYVSLPTSIFGEGPFYILRAKGDSMVDAGIAEGDLIVIRRQESAEVGDTVVALDEENENTLKIFGGVDAETGEAILRYANQKKYPGMEIRTKRLVVQGVAKHVIKDLHH